MGKLFNNFSEETDVFANHVPMRPNPMLSGTINVPGINFSFVP